MSRSGTLLVDTSFLGDLLLAEPMVRRAAALWPEEAVDFLASPSGAGILAGHPQLRELRIFDKRAAQRGLGGVISMARQLRASGYARAICPHRSWRTALLLRLAGIPRRVGFHNAAGAWLYTQRVPYRRDLHEIQRCLSLVETAAAAESSGGAEATAPAPEWVAPRMFPTEEQRATARTLQPEDRYVVMAPGSLWATKRWPREHFQETVRQLTANGQAVVLVGGPDDRERAEFIARGAEGAPGQLTDLTGMTSLHESYALLEHAACLVSNDSSPLHMGVAAETTVIALFCSTAPSLGFEPRGPRDVLLGVDDLSCRPCGPHGFEKCPEQHFRCGLDLSVETVLTAVRESLATPV